MAHQRIRLPRNGSRIAGIYSSIIIVRTSRSFISRYPSGTSSKEALRSKTRLGSIRPCNTSRSKSSMYAADALEHRLSAVRSGLLPSSTICSAPRRFAAMTPHKPTGPSPTSATVFPGGDARSRPRGDPYPSGMAELHGLVGREIAPADSSAGNANECVRRFNQTGVGNILDSNVAGTIHYVARTMPRYVARTMPR